MFLRPGRVLVAIALATVLAASAAAQDEPPPAPPGDDSPLRREVAAIVSELGSEDFATRTAAFEQLRALGRRALPYLEPWLDSDDPEVARLIRRHVIGLRRRAESELLAALDTREDGFADSEELERIVARGREVLPALYGVLDEEDRHYPSYSYYRMRNAYAAIRRLVTEADLDTLLGRLEHPNPQHQYLLRPILEDMDRKKVLDRCFAELADSKANPQARAHLMSMCWSSSFSGNDERVPKIAAGLLDDESGIVRAAALRYFGLRTDDEVLPKILARMTDEESEVRAAAAGALRRYRTPDAAAALKKALRDPDAQVRAATLESIRSTMGPDAAPLVRPYLKDPDPTVRSNAAQAIARFGDRTALPTLLELLTEREEDFLNRALYSVLDALGRIGDPVALGPLRKLLADADDIRQIDNYRYKILATIVQIGGEDVLDEIRPLLDDPNLQNRNMVLDAVGRIESDKVPPILVDALENGDTRLRTSAVRGLATRGYAAAAPAVARLLSEETDFWCLSEAVSALTVFGYRKAVPEMRKLLDAGDPADMRRTSLYYALIRAMKRFSVKESAPRILALAKAHPNYRSVGIDALGRLGDPGVVEGLLEMLEAEENDSVRYRIALALARLGRPEPIEKRLEGVSEGDYRRIDAFLALGRTEDALKIVLEDLAVNPENAAQLYNLACIRSLRGETEEALDALGKALELRTFSRQSLVTDADLAGIRDDPRFGKLLEKAR